MCEVSPDTKVLTFDMKGSTVDRQVLNDKNVKIVQSGNKQEKERIMSIIKKEVLKDKDFTNLGMKFTLSDSDADLLKRMVKSDSDYLKIFNITDYSILVNIHKYYKEDMENKSYKVMASTEKNYIFSFSIIDFLGVKT